MAKAFSESKSPEAIYVRWKKIRSDPLKKNKIGSNDKEFFSHLHKFGPDNKT